MAGQGQRKSSGFNPIWFATAFAVLCILGAAVMVSKKRASMAPPPPQASSLKQPVQTPPVPVMPQPPAAQPAKQATPQMPPSTQLKQTNGRPELVLDNLAGTLRVQIPDVKQGERLPLTHTCYRKNVSPAFSWTGAPAETASLVAIMERRQQDNEPAWTWLLFNIDPKAGSVPAGLPREAQLPGGMKHANNVHGNASYIGPCEPRGQIPYALRVFALDNVINLPGGASRDQLVRAMNGHIIDATDYTFMHYLRF